MAELKEQIEKNGGHKVPCCWPNMCEGKKQYITQKWSCFGTRKKARRQTWHPERKTKRRGWQNEYHNAKHKHLNTEHEHHDIEPEYNDRNVTKTKV